MSLCGEGGAEPTQIPSYLITCYPFVQENQSNRYTHTHTHTHSLCVCLMEFEESILFRNELNVTSSLR